MYKLALGAIEPPIQWVLEALSQQIKQLEHEVDHPSSFTDEVKKMWSHTSTPPYVFTAWCSLK
jgi:hypothetical protein